MEKDITRAESVNVCNKDNVRYNRQCSLDNFTEVQKENQTMLKNKQWTMFKSNRSSNTSDDCSSNTLEAVLRRFGKPNLLRKLEESLEDVRRNKINPEDHNQLVGTEDKELQKMSLKFHPDHAGKTSNLAAVVGYGMQSALNATRTVIRILTRNFLENISVEYRYEYFSNLDISLLANEDEIHKRIQAVFCKICVLSEIKRMNIVGEIRKFLMECQNTVKSYSENNKHEFVKYRDHALHHLQKNIEGYNKLVEECRTLVDECNAENDKNMGSVIQRVMSKAQKDGCILSALERVAKHSFRGKFEIFPVDKTVDEYYILPFVNYVNVLSMCNLLLLYKLCSCMFSHGSLSYGSVHAMFSDAYNLAFDIYHDTRCTAMDKYGVNYYISKTKEAKNILNGYLKAIFEVLAKKFKLDHYREGKSNKTEMHEELLSLKKVMRDLEEKERTFRELLSRTEKDRRGNWNSQKLKVSEIDSKYSINGDKKVSEEFPTPDLNCRLGATEDFTNHGNLGQGNGSGWNSILKREENEAKFGEENSQSKCMEQLSKNLGVEVTMNVGTSANDKISYLYDRGAEKNKNDETLQRNLNWNKKPSTDDSWHPLMEEKEDTEM